MLTRSIKTLKASSQSDVSHNWPKSSWNLKNIRNLSKNQKNLKKDKELEDIRKYCEMGVAFYYISTSKDFERK